MKINHLRKLSLGRLHLTLLPRQGPLIAWEIRACFGATICMGDDDPVIGKIHAELDRNDQLKGYSVEVQTSYASSLFECLPRVVNIIQQSFMDV